MQVPISIQKMICRAIGVSKLRLHLMCSLTIFMKVGNCSDHNLCGAGDFVHQWGTNSADVRLAIYRNWSRCRCNDSKGIGYMSCCKSRCFVVMVALQMRKIESSAFLIWEHKNIYPLVIKGDSACLICWRNFILM